MRDLPGSRSVMTDLALWMSLALLVIGLSMGVVTYLLAAGPIEQQLEQRAAAIASHLVSVLEEPLWNLDDGLILQTLASLPPALDLVCVRVVTEYNDTLAEHRFRDDTDVIVRKAPVYHGEGFIGTVEITLSRESIRIAQKSITRSGMLIVAFGIVAIFLISGVIIHLGTSRTLGRLTDGIREIAAGRYAHGLPRSRYQEIDRISLEINVMARQIFERTRQLEAEIDERARAQAELQALKDDLERQVARRTVALTRANELLAHEVRDRRQAQEEILRISNREQLRIGRDLHDTLGQQLTGIGFLCESMAKGLQSRSPSDATTASRIASLLRDAISQTRRISHGLSPVAMVEEGLGVALRQLAEDTATLFGVTCTVKGADVKVFDNAVATHLYRIVQEAVHNAKRHGDAANITITLSMDHGYGSLLIEDDGKGFPVEDAARSGLGIRVMRYRAESMGGSLELYRNDKGGLTLRTTFRDAPLRDAAAQAG